MLLTFLICILLAIVLLAVVHHLGFRAVRDAVQIEASNLHIRIDALRHSGQVNTPTAPPALSVVPKP